VTLILLLIGTEPPIRGAIKKGGGRARKGKPWKNAGNSAISDSLDIAPTLRTIDFPWRHSTGLKV
jgi:hypothetical protein